MKIACILKLISKIGFLVHYYVLMTCLLLKFYLVKIYKIGTFNNRQQDKHPLDKSHPDMFVHYNDIIKLEGYEFQTFQAETQDNAYVTFWRIRLTDKKKQQRQHPVLIQHGLLDCSMSWFLHEDKTQTLPYILASQGYDVWVGNNRGTKHSSKNSEIKQNYWDFCLDHFIKYDQPALINKVLQQTKAQKLIYIGHSQGSTQFIFGLGQNQDIKNKIYKFFAFGVVTSFQNLKNHGLLNVLAKYHCLQILQKIGFKSVLILPEWMNRKVGVLIYNIKIYLDVILKFIVQLCGKTNQNNFDNSRLGVMVAHEPGGTSVRSIMQWVQAYRNGKIRKFDYGKTQNELIYGQQHPPQYKFTHLKNCPFKSYIFRGTKDAVISDVDFQQMKSHFQKDKLQVFQIQDYAHLDYAWSMSAKNHIYDKIVAILDEDTATNYKNSDQQKFLDQTSQSSESEIQFDEKLNN